MLVLRLELWRRGDPEDVEDLGTVLIANDGSSPTLDVGNYVAVADARDWPAERRTLRGRGWPRLDRSAWALVASLLEYVFGDEVRRRPRFTLRSLLPGDPIDLCVADTFEKLERRLARRREEEKR